MEQRTELENTEQKQWKSMVKILLSRQTGYRKLLTDEVLRIRLQFFCIYIIFSFVSLGMTLVNVITGFRLLMYSTLVFGIANIINFVLCLLGQKTEYVARYLFSAEIIMLMTWFTIMGEPEGFSVIWSVLLPTCGMLLYRLKNGTVVVLIQYVLIVFLFWTPWGKTLLQYPYTDSFLLRFPMLFLAFFALGVFFEFIRHTTQKELTTARAEFEYLYNHDALTGLFNRYGFNITMESQMVSRRELGYAFAIFDLDHFKDINDTYGHMNGDIALKTVAADIAGQVGEQGVCSRWGGEEFAVLFYDPEAALSICDSVIRHRRKNQIDFGEQTCKATISAGLLLVPPGKQLTASELITMADANLYESKENGRDRMTVSSL